MSTPLPSKIRAVLKNKKEKFLPRAKLHPFALAIVELTAPLGNNI
jgi:hypothetical protein